MAQEPKKVIVRYEWITFEEKLARSLARDRLARMRKSNYKFPNLERQAKMFAEAPEHQEMKETKEVILSQWVATHKGNNGVLFFFGGRWYGNWNMKNRWTVENENGVKLEWTDYNRWLIHDEYMVDTQKQTFIAKETSGCSQCFTWPSCPECGIECYKCLQFITCPCTVPICIFSKIFKASNPTCLQCHDYLLMHTAEVPLSELTTWEDDAALLEFANRANIKVVNPEALAKARQEVMAIVGGPDKKASQDEAPPLPQFSNQA